MKAKLPVVLCLFLGLSYGGRVRAQDSPADKEVYAMLQKFYTSYILTWNNVPGPEKMLDFILNKYCDAQLLGKIKKRTESGDLDYDPFLKAQDVDTASLKTFTFGKDPRRVDAFTFSYVANQGKYRPVIHLVVNRLNGSNMIRDVW